MARKATTKKPKEEVLEDILFSCRDSLRGRASLTDKRDMLLTLVFLKFISERYHDRCDEIRTENSDDPEFAEMLLTRQAQFGEKGVFMLTPETDWEALRLIEPKKLAVALDDATSKLMDIHSGLKNALPTGLFVNSGTEGNVIKQVMDEIDKISHKKFKERDLIGRVYEYFLQAFAINANKEDGEFYTPQSIVELIATLIEPFDGTLYDPCCGSGGMFVQCTKFVEQHGGNTLNISVYGQESDPTTYRLAKMNLAVRGITYNLGDRFASTFTHDQHKGRTFRYIMANPPFNLKKWYDSSIENDARWKDYQRPPESNANYAWILHMLSKLDADKGRAGFLLANGALDDEDTVEIRKRLIENDKVEAIIVLPREMFYATDISVTLWILNENKAGAMENGRKLRNRQGEILFIDLRSWNQNIYEKKFVKLSPEQIAEVHKIYTDWQTNAEPGNYAKPELYRSVTKNELEANNWSLVPSRYIEFVDRDIYEDNNLSKIIDLTSSSLSSLIVQSKECILDLEKAYAGLNIFNQKSNQECSFEILGNYIEKIDFRNTDNRFDVSHLKGVTSSGVFDKSKAKTDGIDFSKYKIINPGDFAYNPSRINLGSIALCNSTCIVSPMYISFRVRDDKKKMLLPEFLNIWFTRSEFQRSTWFYAAGSVRDTFSFEEMCRVKVPVPPLVVQETIVNIFNCVNSLKALAENAELSLKPKCPTLMINCI